MKGLSVLSFGSTRGLWDGESADDYQRMMGYAEHLDEYVIIAHSYKRHGLKPRRLSPHVEAIPTDAFCRFDSFLRMLRIGYAKLRARSFSLIQAQDPFYLGVIAILLGKRFRVPVNICLYGPNIYDTHWLANHWSHRLLARLGRWVLGQCHGVQVDGQLTANRLIAAGVPPERVELKKVVPANLDHFLKINHAARNAGDAARILYVGRFANQKNLPLLLRAVKLLRAREVDSFELVLVGEGPEKNALRAIVDREGLQTCVKFHGPVARDKIADVFAHADVFALTSDFEGYPRVLMEAAASALPIVTTAVSGSDEAVIDGETGYIVPVGDAQAVANKLAAILANREARVQMGRAARDHIRAHLDPRANTPGQLAIWRKIANNAVPRLHPERSEVSVAIESQSKDPAERLRPIRRLLLFNLVTDAKHPILGFTTQWICELAARVEHIHVITMQAGEIAVPDNVTVLSVGKERGYSEPRRAIEFYRHLFNVLRTERVDGCFSHMMPIFSVLAGPVLRTAGIPLVTWYAHPSLTPTLKLAHFFSNQMVASLPNAYPYRRNKLAVIGQGIDTTMFAPSENPAASDDVILCVGRLSRVKNHPTLLRAAALLRRRFRVVILGATSGADDEAYAAELRQLVDQLALRDVVVFEKAVPPAELPSRYLACAVHVNLTPTGFGDKVAWEAMACGRPCLVANEDFRETLGRYADELLFRVNDPVDLAAKLSAALEKSAAEGADIGAYLRSQVERLHSLPRLAERILELLDGISASCPGNPKQSRSVAAHRLPKLSNVKQAARRVFHVCTHSPETILYRVACRISFLNHCKFRFRWKGYSFWARPVDGVALQEIFLDHEYGFAARILARAENSSHPIIIDCGANIGLFSLAMLVAYENATVYALEPDARTFQVLSRNANANPDLRWRVFPLALWKASGPLKFGATASSTASRVYELAPEGRVETVEAITLGGFIDSQCLGQIDLLKLDIEGAEEVVLRESEAVLDRIEHVVVEIHPPRADENSVMRLLRTHFPHINLLPRRNSAKPLVLASRRQTNLS